MVRAREGRPLVFRLLRVKHHDSPLSPIRRGGAATFNAEGQESDQRICKRPRRPWARSADQLQYSLSAWHASGAVSKGRRSLPLRTPRGNHQLVAEAKDFASDTCGGDTQPFFHRTNLLLWYLGHALVLLSLMYGCASGQSS